MNSKFENRYKVDKSKFIYMFTHPMKNSKKIYIHYAFLIFGLFVLCLFSKLYTFWGGRIEKVIIIFWICYCTYMIFFYRQVLANKQFKIISQKYGKNEWEVVTKFEDSINITENDRNVEIKYEDVDEIIVKNDYIGILQGNEKGVRLDTNGFDNSTVEEFLEFIKSKCEKAVVINNVK